MATCDLCGKSCDMRELETLRQQYQVAGISDICPSCAKWANKLKTNFILEISQKMQDALVEKKGASAVTKKRWWQIARR